MLACENALSSINSSGEGFYVQVNGADVGEVEEECSYTERKEKQARIVSKRKKLEDERGSGTGAQPIGHKEMM